MTLSTPPRSDPDRYGRRATTAPFGQRAAVLAREGRSALGLLRERAWVLALFGVIFLSIVFVFLGRWQYGRHVSRSAKNHQVTSNYAALPAALDQVLPAVRTDPRARVPLALQWRSVRLTGEYLPDDTALIRNRPYSTTDNDSSNGYEVVVPLKLDDGGVLLIDRGWIPSGDSGATRPDSIPAPPSGHVTVVAHLRPSEPASTRQAPEGQAIRITPEQLATRLPEPLNQQVVNGFAVLASETPPAATTPRELDPPDPGLGINLAYAVQWVLFAIAAYVLFAISGIKEVRRRAAGGLMGRG